MNPVDLIPSGYATKLSGFLMLAGAIGLGADYVGQIVGADLFTQETTWPMVVGMFSAGLGLLGLRRAVEKG